MKTWIELAQEHLGIVLSVSQRSQFEILQNELLEWNKSLNLTAIRDLRGVQERHFFDSLISFQGFSCLPDTLIDVGTGAGFPGLPIKIVHPALKLTLVESVEKKANFCRHIAEKLGLSDVTVLTSRIEEIGQMPNYREKFDIAIARAVAPMPTLAEYLLPLVKVGGRAVMQKGLSVLTEAASSGRIVSVCGGKLSALRHTHYEGIEGAGYLVVIDKHHHTPKEFPRAVGIPTKKPMQSNGSEEYLDFLNKLINE